METKKYFYRKVLISTICTGSIIVYLLSSSKILGATPSSDYSYLQIEAMPAFEMNPQTEAVTTNNVTSGETFEDTIEYVNETTIEMNADVDNEETQENVYVVQEGETLWEIAQEIDISIQDLIQENNLSNGVISEGQELIIN